MKKLGKRFDMYAKPHKPRWYLQIIMAIAVPFLLMSGKAKVKVDKKLKINF